MLRTIHLHGDLAERFGPTFELNVSTVSEAGRALGVVVPGFADHVRSRLYRVRVADIDLGLDQLNLRVGTQPIHIIPALEGGGGMQKVIIGAVLVAAAFTGAYFLAAPAAFAPMGAGAAAAGFGGAAVSLGGVTLLTWGNIAALGAAIALSGISQMLAPKPKTEEIKQAQTENSFLFNGPLNVSIQGECVPIVYGEVLAGSVIASAGLVVEQLLTPAGGDYGPAPPPGPSEPPPVSLHAFSKGFSKGFS